MIRTDAEYRRALQRLAAEAETLKVQRAHLIALGLSQDEVERAMHPLLSFHAQLVEEVDAYARMKRGDIGPLASFAAIGRWLVGARIARGLSQADLAAQLGVHVSQVSRDERNDYRGITAERAQVILEALGVRFVAHAESLLEVSPAAEFEQA